MARSSLRHNREIKGVDSAGELPEHHGDIYNAPGESGPQEPSYEPWRTVFGGGALPAGWTFEQNQVPNAVLDTSGSFADVTIPAGTSSDSFSNATGPDDSAGLLTAVSGDFDIAAQVAVAIGGDNSSMFGFIIREASDTEAIRWSVYADIRETNIYGIERHAGISNIFQSPSTTPAAWLNGHYHWIRARRTGSLYEFLMSYDGRNWEVMSSVDCPVDAITLKLKTGQFNLDLGFPIRWVEVCDMVAAGQEDVRRVLPTTTQSELQSTDFTTLPSWLEISAAVDGSAVHTSGKVTLATAQADGSRAVISYIGAGHEDAGMLVSFSRVADDLNGYAVFGLEADDGGDILDVYMDAPGYINEFFPFSRLSATVLVKRPVATNAFNEPYTILGPKLSSPDVSSFHVRVEHVNTRLRLKIWEDGDTEPAEWNIYDGDCDVLRGVGPLKPFIGIGHNPSNGSDATIDVTAVEFYKLTA